MAKKTYTLEVDVEASSQTLDEAIKKMEKMVSLKAELKGGVFSIPDGDVKKIVDQKAVIDDLTKSIKKQSGIISELEKAKQKLEKARSKEAQELAAVTLETNKQNKANRDAARDADKSVGAYEKLSRSLIKSKQTVKDLIASKKALTDEDKKLIKHTQELDKELKKIDRDLGDGHRTVGLYADGIKEAISETRIFDSETAKILVSLRNLKKEWDENTEGENKFSNGLKLLGVGLAIAAIGALVKIANAGVEASQSLSDAADKLSIRFGSKGLEQAAAAAAASLAGYNTNLSEARTLSIQFVDTLTSSKKALTELSLKNKELSAEEDIFRQKSDDGTIGLQERIKALKIAQEIDRERLENNLSQAKINLSLADAELKIQENLVGSGQAKLEFYEKQKESLNEVTEAEKELAHSVAINAQQQRLLFQEQIVNNIELTRSKKLTANSDQVRLQNQLNDEKVQLEERKKLAIQLQNLNIKAIDSEAKELEKAGISRELFNEAVAAGDEVQLKDLVRKKAANIEGTIIETELFKVVKQAQENQIRNAELIKKQEEEEIKRKQKIQDINNQISINQTEFDISEVEREERERLRLYEETTDKILKEEDLFNHKLHNKREFNFEFEKAASVALYEKQVELLQKKSLAEIDAIYASENDEQVRNKKIEELREKHNQELTKLEKDQAEKELEIQRKKLEDDKKIQQAQVNYIADRLDFVTDKINEQLDKRSELELERIDKLEEKNDEALERQIKRAEEGKVNDVETYQLKQAQLEKAKADQEKKDKRREKVLAYYNLLSGYAKEDANTALPRAARDIAISEAISAAFAEKGGIAGEVSDRTTLGSSKTHGAGRDVLVMADKDEGILTTRQMKNLGGPQAFYDLQAMLNNPQSDNVLFPEVPTFTNIAVTNNSRVEEKLNELIDITKKKPVPQSRMDNVGNVITTTFEDGKKHILKTVSKKPAFRR